MRRPIGTTVAFLNGVPIIVPVVGDTNDPSKDPGKAPKERDGAATTVDRYLPRLTLQTGMCGQAVHLWQQWLVAASRGAYFTPPALTGQFDAATQEATLSLQRALRIKADGIVGASTRAAAFQLLTRQKNTPAPAPFVSASRCAPSADPVVDVGTTEPGTLDALTSGLDPTILLAVGAVVLLVLMKSGGK